MIVKFKIKVSKITNDIFNMSYNTGQILQLNEYNELEVDLTSKEIYFSFGGTTTYRNRYCYDVISTLFVRPLEYNGIEDYKVYPIVQNRPWKKDGTQNNILFISNKLSAVSNSEECIINIDINERLNDNTLLVNSVSYNVKNTRLVYADYTLTKLADVINGSDFNNGLNYLFQNPAEFVEYQIALPFDVRNLRYYSSVEEIENVENIQIGRLGFSGCQSQLFENMKSNIYLGSIKCERVYNDFRDYSPYSTIHLFIAYYGFIQLDPSVVMGKTIRVYAILNINDGSVTFVISADNKLIQTFDSKMGVLFTMGSSSAIQSLINITKGFTAGAVAGGLTGSVAGVVVGGTIGALSNAQMNYNKGTLNNASSSFNNNQNLYLYIETTKGYYPDGFSSLYGKPLNNTKPLNTLTGFTKIKEIHLENFNNASSSELNEIEELLKQGVIL